MKLPITYIGVVEKLIDCNKQCIPTIIFIVVFTH